MISTAMHAQPVISYILPDIGAPGMAVYMELMGPNSGDQNGNVFSVNVDSIFSNNATDPLRLECVRPSDRWKITFSPVVISWAGRLLSTVAFVSPACSPNSSDWRQLSAEWRIPVQVVTTNGTSNIDTVYIVQPTRVGSLIGVTQTVLGAGSLGVRSRRGAMIVDSIIFRDITYTVSTNDPDGIAANGNQGYLPFTLMSIGPVRGAGSNTKLSVDAIAQDAGPGGGGGAGRFCDLAAGTGTRGGNGFSGGGRGGNSLTRLYQSYGTGTGTPLSDGTSNSLNDTRGSSVPAAFEAAGGGTGHPFGVSGSSCSDGNGCIPEGGVGGGSGAQNNIAGAGGGNESAGQKSATNIDNGGKVHGNTMIIPIAGGSGGSSGNPRSAFGSCGGVGGGGGGALRLVAPTVSSLLLSATGADGGATVGSGATEIGGSGAGGSVSLHTQYGLSDVNYNLRPGGLSSGTGRGGNGRGRCDGPQARWAGLSIFRGPSIDTIQNVSLPFLLTGTGEPNSRIELYVYTETEKWRRFAEGGVDAAGNWAGLISYSGSDSYINIVAVQKASIANPKGYAFVPSHILSPSAAVVVKIQKVAQIVCDANRDMGRSTCSNSGSVADTMYIRNKGAGVATIDSARFSDGNRGFSLLSPLPFRGVNIQPGDSLRVVVRFQRNSGSTGIVSDRLLVFLKSGTVPPICTTDYKISVDAVGLVKANTSTGEIDPGEFAFDLGEVCNKTGGIKTFAVKNVSSFTVGVVKYAMVSGPTSMFQVGSIQPAIGAGSNASIVITVAPGSKGVYTDTLRITIDSCNLTYDIPVRVRIVETVVIGYSAALEKFGFVQIGQSVTRTLVIRNEGRGTDSAYFETVPSVTAPWSLVLRRPASLPTMLAPGDSILFDITFKPDTAGYYEQSITWETLQRAPSCATTVIFKPNGFGSNSSVAPNKTDINFGTVYHCQRRRDTVWVRNLGSTEATISGLATLGGTDPQWFIILSQPSVSSVIKSGDSVAYVVEFSPDPNSTLTTLRTATLTLTFNDGSTRTINITLSGTQKRASLQILDALPIVVNSVPVNSSVSVQLGVQNLLDTVICITDVRAQNEADVRPDIRTFDIPKGQQRAFQFTITPKSLADLIDTATIYIGCPCVDSIKVPIIAYPTNTALLFTPRPVSFDTVDVCERPQPIRLSVKNLDVSSTALIDTVFIEGKDVDVFQMRLPVWTSYPVPVGSNNTLSSAIVVYYDGSGRPGGLKTARIIVNYRLNSIYVRDTIQVSAYRAVPVIASKDSIQFGTIKQGEVTSASMDIKNILSQQIEVSFGFVGNTAQAFSAQPALIPLAGGQSSNVTVNFSGIATGLYADSMYIRYYSSSLGCTDSVPIHLFGEVLPGLNYKVWLKSNVRSLATDKAVEFHVMGTTDSVARPLRGVRMRTVVSVPGDMYFPRSARVPGGTASIASISQGLPGTLDVEITADSLPNGISQDTTLLAILSGDALLGARECDSLRIVDFSWTNAGPRPTTWLNKDQGSVQYCTEICKQGGDRLVGGAVRALTLSIRPNPADDHADISVDCVESGLHTVKIYNDMGREVQSASVKGYAAQRFQLQPELSELHSGTYTVVVVSPTQCISAPLIVVK
jgi:hypothetical protein